MRYSIDHVLEGIQLARKARLEGIAAEIGTHTLELEALRERRADAPRRLADLLRELANRVDEMPVVSHTDYELVRTDIIRLERGTPSQYDVDNLARNITTLQDRHAELAKEHAAADTQLEQFLRAVQAGGGETQVSQHGLKQAGFNAEPVTRYIVARLQAIAETPNG